LNNWRENPRLFATLRALLGTLGVAAGIPVDSALAQPPPDGNVRLLSHNNAAAEIVVYAESGNRDFVLALLDAVEAVNADAGARPFPIINTRILYKRPGSGLGLLRRRERSADIRFTPTHSRMDVWVQDVAEIGSAAGTTTPLLLATSRGRALDRVVPDLAAAWNGAWLPLPRPDDGDANGAGNIEALPNGLVMLGSTAGMGLRRFLAERGYLGALAVVDTDWLEIGHVDEIVSHVILRPGAGDCGFALLRASPGAALDALAAHRGEIDAPASVRRLHDALRGSARDKSESVELLATQRELETRLSRAASELARAVAEHSPACRGVHVEPIPVLFECRSGRSRCRALGANPVNMAVLNHHLVVPDPRVAILREDIARRLRALGQSVHFVDDRFYARRKGGVHCATNVLRRPDVLVEPAAGR